VEAALLPTHVHPEGIDGACILAHGVIRMSQMTPAQAEDGAWRASLLGELLSGVATTDKAR
jgi:hypothetical protein